MLKGMPPWIAFPALNGWLERHPANTLQSKTVPSIDEPWALPDKGSQRWVGTLFFTEFLPQLTKDSHLSFQMINHLTERCHGAVRPFFFLLVHLWQQRASRSRLWKAKWNPRPGEWQLYIMGYKWRDEEEGAIFFTHVNSKCSMVFSHTQLPTINGQF